MTKFEYAVQNTKGGWTTRYKIDVKDSLNCHDVRDFLNYWDVSLTCAREYYNKRKGTRCYIEWPIKLKLYSGGVEVGTYSVEMTLSPIFNSVEVET